MDNTLDWNNDDDDLGEVDVYGFIQELRQKQLDEDRKEQNSDFKASKPKDYNPEVRWDDPDNLVPRRQRDKDYSSELQRLTSEIEEDKRDGFLYLKRFEFLMAMSEYDMALGDAMDAIVNSKNKLGAFNKVMDSYLTNGLLSYAGALVDEFGENVRRENEQLTKYWKLMELQSVLDENVYRIKCKKSLKLIDQILQDAPESSDDRFLKVCCLLVLNRLDEAQKEVEILVDGLIWKHRAFRAIELLDLLVRLASNFEDLVKALYLDLAKIFSKFQLGQANANKYAQKVLDIDPLQEEALLIKLHTYARQENFERSVPQLQEFCKKRYQIKGRANEWAEISHRMGKASLSPKTAIKHYTNAIQAQPLMEYLVSRMKTYHSMGEIDLAMADSMETVRMGKHDWSGYRFTLIFALTNGDIEKMDSFLRMAVRCAKNAIADEVEQLNSQIIAFKADHRKITSFYANDDFEKCFESIEQPLKDAYACIAYQKMKIECLLMLNKLELADQMLKVVLERYPDDADMVFLEGLRYYLDGDIENSILKFAAIGQASSYYGKAIRYQRKAKHMQNLEKSGTEELNSGRYVEAINNFSAALNVDPLIKNLIPKVLYQRGLAYFGYGSHEKAYNDFTKFLKVDPNHVEALMMRARTHFALREFDECIIDCQELLKLQPSQEQRNLIKTASRRLKNMKALSDYAILKVRKNPTLDEISKAFQKATKQHKIDIKSNPTAVDKKKVELKFEKVKNAYKNLLYESD